MKRQPENRVMPLRSSHQNYLNDQNKGLKDIITIFLNLVMQQEAEQLVGAVRYQVQNPEWLF